MSLTMSCATAYRVKHQRLRLCTGWFVLFWGWGTWPVWAQGHAVPQMQLSAHTLALGEPLELVFTRRHPPAAAPATATTLPDLGQWWAQWPGRAAWLQHGAVYSEQRGLGNGVEELRLTLYPRATGTFVLPVPDHRQPHTPPALTTTLTTTLTVTSGSDAVAAVHWHWQTDPAQGQQRQPMRLSLQACHTLGLRWQAPVLPPTAGFMIVPLSEDNSPARVQGQDCTAQRWHWAITPSAAGAHTLALPWIEARQFGRLLRFPVPPYHWTVAALPLWLPSGLAVGAPHAQWMAPERAAADEAAVWELEIAGSYSAAFLRQWASTQAQQDQQNQQNQQNQHKQGQPSWITAAFEVQAQRSTTTDPRPRWRLRLPAQAPASGVWTAPTWALPWWDAPAAQVRHLSPGSAQIDVAVAPLSWRRWGGVLIACAVALGVSGWVGRSAVRERGQRWWGQRQEARWRKQAHRCTRLDELQQVLDVWWQWRVKRPSSTAGLVPLDRLAAWRTELHRLRFGPAPSTPHEARRLRHQIRWANPSHA
jgi:hypothetical protein